MCEASRGQIAIPSPDELSKTFTESPLDPAIAIAIACYGLWLHISGKDPSYKGPAYKPCKLGELDKTCLD